MRLTKIDERKYIQGKDLKGSNQHYRVVRVRRQARLRGFAAVGVIGSVLFTAFVVPFYNDNKFKPAYAPTVKQAYAEPAITATPTPDERQEIRDYIKEVFGKDADKAFKLLTDPKCHENGTLNPSAVNTAGNYPEGSRDIGVFQINEFWQKVHSKFLFNWKTNVVIAHQIYTDSDNSFSMWTCGRKLGI